MDDENERCDCGHRLFQHISFELSTDNLDLCCGKCGCDSFVSAADGATP